MNASIKVSMIVLSTALLLGAGCAIGSSQYKTVNIEEALQNESEKIKPQEETPTNTQEETTMNTQDETAGTGLSGETQATTPTCKVYPTPPVPARVKKAYDGTVLPDGEIVSKQVRIKTAKGDIVFELFPGEAPCTVSNFVTLAKQGFYDGLTFHRVVPGFVIQGGDPLGDGSGHPGYRFDDEPVKLPYDKGIVAMANSGPNTNGSQFFVMLESQYLPPQYTIFGNVLEGMAVVEKIEMGDVMESVTIESTKTAS